MPRSKQRNAMASPCQTNITTFILFLLTIASATEAYYSSKLVNQIQMINEAGPYLGLVAPNKSEMDPLLRSSVFVADENIPYTDISGRRFRIGTVMGHRVIVVMTGLGMINAAVTTQLLLGFFHIYGVIHYGTAGSAKEGLHIGDVTVARQWAHTGLWNWQKYGRGENDELAWEAGGDYTREIGYLNFANFSTPPGENIDNLLNNLWYQPDEHFPVNGAPEVREHVFWIPTSESYYQLAEKIKDLKLDSCLNSTTCLSHEPKVVKVERGCSSNIFVDNEAYRNFLHQKFDVTPIDMESAGVALVCMSESQQFIAMRAVVGVPRGPHEESNPGSFIDLAIRNAVTTVSQFVSLLPSPQAYRPDA